MKIIFNIHYNTQIGERIQLVLFENEQEKLIYPLEYTDNGNWRVEVDYFTRDFCYQYQLVTEEGRVLKTEFSFHQLQLVHTYNEYKVYDVWNLKNFPENYLNNKILKNTRRDFKAERLQILKRHTHLFRIEAPIYKANQRLVLLGSAPELGSWEYLKTVPMAQTAQGVWEVAVEIAQDNFIQYKYGILDELTGEVFEVEYGKNRWALSNLEPQVLQIQADHYFRFKAQELYHAAGVAVPVFSLRSEKGFGVGEFSDLKLLAEWAEKTNLSVVQTLPINDTTANFTWTDSYPYAPISLYALHPIYINIEELPFKLDEEKSLEFLAKKAELNSFELVDYEQVIENKWHFITLLFEQNKQEILKEKAFKKFQNENKDWLHPYAAFCILRDQNKTPNFEQWKTHRKYVAGKIAPFFQADHKFYDTAMLHLWVQYQLHLQLTDAVDYAHSIGISLKGDLPIGIYRYSVEAWTEPQLYGMDFQAGAPPDQFTEIGQNWGFPTYNWEAMKEDGYRWWKSRFQALEKYFDAMRIDHILGFFRIWRMPISATQGILGYFYPAIPVTLEEFQSRGIHFDWDRFVRPYVNEQILWDFFGSENNRVRDFFMNAESSGLFRFKPEFDTQRKLSDFFRDNPWGWIEDKLLTLCANVLFLEEHKEGHAVYHPRFGVENTASFQHLDDSMQNAIRELYSDYFFHRQESLWSASAMEKLPAILNSTDMLICGEDLGMVPKCVPEVMDSLAITALKVQRMPSEDILWYDPKNAGYMNVVTGSSHDSSTLRQWWCEDPVLTQKYYNAQLNQGGNAPDTLEPALAEIIMLQHLYNEAMLSVFPIQEFFATDRELRNPDKDLERINDPAQFPHYWRYRMHLTLEFLGEQDSFNKKIAYWIQDSGRKSL